MSENIKFQEYAEAFNRYEMGMVPVSGRIMYENDRNYGGNQNGRNSQKAILAVSFGTSHSDTRKVTIDAIEEDLKAAFEDCSLYRAWTSKMILARLEKRDGIHYDNVKRSHGTYVKGRHHRCDRSANPRNERRGK